MKKLSILIFISISLTFCGKVEENRLIAETEKAEKYRISITETKVTDKDSIWFEKKSFKVYDRLNRVINENDNSFLFYDSKNKLINTKLIYKREGKGFPRIINRKRIYNSKGKLIAILNDSNPETDTIVTFTYNSSNKVIKEENNTQKTLYEYKNNLISKKTIIESNDTIKTSNYFYDKSGKIISEVWIFSGKNKVKSFYKYYPNNKLLSKRDSSYSVKSNPNEYVEFLTEYYYDKNDSISEIRSLGRVLSETDFKLKGKTKFKYRKK
ncbi:hypothetical protein RCH33_3235 [Flavobacterium daejeonense]|nr:hypothetical protein RCH33_3235 [Flavobacterium daejeonense]